MTEGEVAVGVGRRRKEAAQDKAPLAASATGSLRAFTAFTFPAAEAYLNNRGDNLASRAVNGWPTSHNPLLPAFTSKLPETAMNLCRTASALLGVQFRADLDTSPFPPTPPMVMIPSFEPHCIGRQLNWAKKSSNSRLREERGQVRD